MIHAHIAKIIRLGIGLILSPCILLLLPISFLLTFIHCLFFLPLDRFCEAIQYISHPQRWRGAARALMARVYMIVGFFRAGGFVWRNFYYVIRNGIRWVVFTHHQWCLQALRPDAQDRCRQESDREFDRHLRRCWNKAAVARIAERELRQWAQTHPDNSALSIQCADHIAGIQSDDPHTRALAMSTLLDSFQTFNEVMDTRTRRTLTDPNVTKALENLIQEAEGNLQSNAPDKRAEAAERLAEEIFDLFQEPTETDPSSPLSP